MSVHNEIAELRSQIDLLEARVLEDEVNISSDDLSADPEVQEAAARLAQAIARSQGIDMPMMAGGNSGLPIMTLPEEFLKFGGIGIGVVMAAPPEAEEEF